MIMYPYIRMGQRHRSRSRKVPGPRHGAEVKRNNMLYVRRVVCIELYAQKYLEKGLEGYTTSY